METKPTFRLTYSTMFDPPPEMHERFDAALARVEPLVGTWWDQLKPTGTSYRAWGHQLEVFIGGRVQSATVTPRRKSA